MVKAKLIGILILTVISIILVSQNTELMTTKFLFWEITLTRSVSFLVVFLIGMLWGTLMVLFFMRRHRKKKEATLDKPSEGQSLPRA